MGISGYTNAGIIQKGFPLTKRLLVSTRTCLSPPEPARLVELLKRRKYQSIKVCNASSMSRCSSTELLKGYVIVK